MTKGMVFDIKEFTVHDGPGIRTTVFLKGCPLRCLWCHNPEGISPQPQLMVSQNGCTHCGRCRIPCNHPECQPFGRCVHACPNGLLKIAGEEVDSADLAERLLHQADLLTAGEGGITFSGGEPLLQPEFLFDMLARLSSLHTIIETSGYASEEIFHQAVERCSMLYMDIKHLDDATHRRVTGVSNARILRNLHWLKQQRKPFIIRVPLIPGINDDKQHLARIAALLEDAQHLERVEFMPYNPFTPAKYTMADMAFSLYINADDYHPEIPVNAFAQRGIRFRVL